MTSHGNDSDVLTGEAEPFQAWALVELMGHRKLAGWVTQEQRFGAPMLRIDVPGASGVAATQFYGPAALYCVTPISEQTARRFALMAPPEPVQAWELAPSDTTTDMSPPIYGSGYDAGMRLGPDLQPQYLQRIGAAGEDPAGSE